MLLFISRLRKSIYDLPGTTASSSLQANAFAEKPSYTGIRIERMWIHRNVRIGRSGCIDRNL